MDRIYRVKFRFRFPRLNIIIDYIVGQLVNAGFHCSRLGSCMLRVYNHTPSRDTMLALKISSEDWWLEPVGWVESGAEFDPVRMEDEYHG
jgi:hypothetical protein